MTNAELTTALGRVLRRPTVVPRLRPCCMPLFGRETTALGRVLGRPRVVPAALSASGFEFAYLDTSGLRHALRG